MAQSNKSRLSADDKAKLIAKYKVDQKKFSGILKELTGIFTALIKLNTDFVRTGDKAKTFYPRDPNTGEVGAPLILTYKEDVKTMNKLFIQRIKELSKYFRYSKTKARTTKEPTAENLSGVYSPVQAGPALQYFFQQGAGNFGYRSPIAAVNLTAQIATAAQQLSSGQITNEQYNAVVARVQQEISQLPALMSQLPLVQEGKLLRNTITMLFYIYAHAATHPFKTDANGQPIQGLQDPDNAQLAASDAVMTTAFGGNIPAMFYSRHLAGKKDADKVPMDVAVQNALIAAPINTYTNLSQLHPVGSVDKNYKPIDFKPEAIHTFYFQSIAAANYVSPKFLDAAGAAPFADMNTRRAMLTEHNIVAETSAEWNRILEPIRKETRKQRTKAKQAADRAAKQAAAAAGFAQ